MGSNQIAPLPGFVLDNIPPPPGFVLDSAPPPGFVIDEPWGVEDTLRSAGAVIGGFAAMPVAGLGGLSRLITTGSLDEASKTMEGISSVPSGILTTERQKQAAGKVGELISLPFVKAGEGWQAIGKITGIPYAEPVLGTMGEAAGMVAVGGVVKAVKGRLKPVAERSFRSIEEVAKPIEEIKVAPPEGFVIDKPVPPKGFVVDEVPKPVAEKDMTPTGDLNLTSGIDISRVKEVATSLYESVKNPPKWTTFMEALGKFGGRIQMGNLEMHRYAQGLKKRVPDKVSREAIVNYLQTDGDLVLLAERSTNTAANPKTKHLAEGYKRAGKLNPEELKVAAEVKEHYEARLKEAIDVDMLDAGIENYVNQVWSKENPITAKLKGEIVTGKLAPNPSFIRKRIFESYFEGEQAGYTPKNKDIGFLLTSYYQAFNKAIASRAFIKSLNEKMASDGRPLTHPSGMGMPIPKEGVAEVILVKPRLKPEEDGDYLPINQPALRKWKWASEVEGVPIYLQGDLLVHPEIYRHLKNVLGTSALRQNPIGKAALTTVQSLKGTLLSLSG